MYRRIVGILKSAWNRLGSRPRFTRKAIARAYLRGSGIEIGALHRPLRVSADARVSYVDRLWTPGLLNQYPELAAHRLVPVDLIDNGEKLASIADSSQDFVVANHFLEHCQDPIGALRHFFRVLKVGGVLYAAVPDKRHTFDRERPTTSLDHLIRDNESGPEGSRQGHVEEWTRLVNGVEDPEEVARQTGYLLDSDYSIHYHVWTQTEFLDLLLHVRNRQPFEIELFLQRGYEIVVVMRKLAEAAGVPVRSAA